MLRPGGMAATTRQVQMSREQEFASKLRYWRHRRGWSQLELIRTSFEWPQATAEPSRQTSTMER